MENYIGTQIIDAKPMNSEEAYLKGLTDKRYIQIKIEGYYVIFIVNDNKKTRASMWLPKSFFESVFSRVNEKSITIDKNEDYISRLEIEQQQLTERINKLRKFRYSEKFDALSLEEQLLLNKQYYAMADYEDILFERIERAKSKEK